KGYDSIYTDDRETVVSNIYTDYENVTDFAKEPILWAIEKGVITGKTNTTIDPQGNAQRCEVAKIMYNIFLNDIFY
ncbi:MAG: S-layer homology domain-containing protein, partial [Clostridia bacterium]|nr:S-layer homology domain-containing protein [Clostridia bacterium]